MSGEWTIRAGIITRFLQGFLGIVVLQWIVLPGANAQGTVQVLERAVDLHDAVQAAQETSLAQSVSSEVTLPQDRSWILLNLTGSESRVLHLATPSLETYRFFTADGSSLFVGGSAVAGWERPIWFPEYLLPLDAEWGDRLLVELDWHTGTPLPVKLMTAFDANRITAGRLLGDGIYYGSIALMALFALFIGAFYSDRHSGRLSITLVVWVATVSFSWGYADLINPFYFGTSIYPFTNTMVTLASLVSAWFIYHFLCEAAAGNILLRGLRLCMWSSLAYLVAFTVLPIGTGAAPLFMLATGFFGVACSVVATLRGDAASRYLVMATFTTSFPFLLLYVATPTQQVMLVAGIVALIMVSLALLKRIGERLRAHELKAQVNDERERFLATMSHEIRTPLNGIIGFSELISQETLDGKVQEYFDQIFRSSRMLADIVNDVLDYSRMSAGSIPVDLQSTHLENMLKNVMAIINPLAHKNQVQVTFSIARELSDHVVTDHHRCTQILVNLCSNAVKFSKGGTVKMHATRDDDRLCLAVADNGIGIDSAVLDGLFNPFQQAGASTARQYGGSGLGLAISKQLASLLDGDLMAHSEPGVGSTFTLHLPYVEGEAPAQAPELETINLEGLSILLAEDNPVNAMLATRILENSGVQVDHAEDGSVAVEKAAASRYDIILMDMQMPELSGTEAATQIREGGCEAPIIAMTANTAESDRDACLAAGMSDYLAKPIVQNHLLAKLEFWSGQKH